MRSDEDVIVGDIESQAYRITITFTNKSVFDLSA